MSSNNKEKNVQQINKESKKNARRKYQKKTRRKYREKIQKKAPHKDDLKELKN